MSGNKVKIVIDSGFERVAKFNSKSGVTAVGAREFLIAYNINLNTNDRTYANEIAYEKEAAAVVAGPGDDTSGKKVVSVLKKNTEPNPTRPIEMLISIKLNLYLFVLYYQKL